MASDLLAAVNAYLGEQGGGEGHFELPMGGVHILRSFHQVAANHALYRPSLCVVLQGGKRLLIGGDRLEYGAMQCLVVSMELPACGGIVAANPEEPFVGVTLDFEPAILRDVLSHLESPPAPPRDDEPAVFVADVSDALADCILRLVRLAETPQAIPVLFPAILRELYYWLLTGPYGGQISRQALPENHLARISRAIWLLRENFTETLPVDRLASAAGMSVSSFHHHFKSLTSMTPLQFQKQLRLLEARRLMLSDTVNVTEAAFRVGYESASQFSREYSRTFGVAPKRDTMSMRAPPPDPVPA